MVKPVLSAIVLVAALVPALGRAEAVRPNVDFAGVVEPVGSKRAAMQDLIFDLATAWADCNVEAMTSAVADTVKFSYPTTAYEGKATMLKDLETFCGQATDTSIFFPADAFYIDVDSGRIAAELQFRTFQRGNRQVVNDVWVATIADDKITVIKEYLDGRVKDLQAQGVLQLEESPEFLTPWPPRTEAWEACFPIAKSAPINTCPPT
ncbi:nuclear transport factor 2 family protein [Pseudoruegeria sp. SK021]|uniref:nuclear transport factor 2 family protein n=1 Tax=Pseudoruegeria sp. SK021 TaxID=1933035 RepID=UPI000A249BD3|nr:nuclear transport factor 2 family protein [Pseudoruegeria sp. SK021]OSP55837.1 hypothetical protein BV911_05555 [Pseudoruegeria sp. SK021]